MAGANILFEFESIAAENRFLREYLTDAWKRFEAGECSETGWFWRFGQFNEYIDHDSGSVSHDRSEWDGSSERVLTANLFQGL